MHSVLGNAVVGSEGLGERGFRELGLLRFRRSSGVGFMVIAV